MVRCGAGHGVDPVSPKGAIMSIDASAVLRSDTQDSGPAPSSHVLAPAGC